MNDSIDVASLVNLGPALHELEQRNGWRLVKMAFGARRRTIEGKVLWLRAEAGLPVEYGVHNVEIDLVHGNLDLWHGSYFLVDSYKDAAEALSRAVQAFRDRL